MKNRLILPFIAALLLNAWTASAVVSTHRTTPQPQKVCFATFGMTAPLSIQEFVRLSMTELEQKTGKSLSFKEKMGFKLTQWKLKRWLKAHPLGFANIGEREDTGEFKFNIGAFLLGLFLGLIGLIITFFFEDKKAWISGLIGFGILLAIIALLLQLNTGV